MSDAIQLRINQPCHESWNAMLPSEKGKFCLSCQKEVVDFTTMTDQEILDHISTAARGVCGRASNDQLNRLLVTPAAPRKTWWKYWMGVAASLVLVSKSYGQATRIMGDTIVVTTRPAEEMLVGKIAADPGSNRDGKDYSVTVTGTVTDGNNQPLAGATIVLKDTKKATLADSKGFFTIRIEDARHAVLRISYVGFEAQDIKIGKQAGQSFIRQNVVLKDYVTMGLVGEVVVTRTRKKSLVHIFKRDSVKATPAVCSPALGIYPNPVTPGTNITMQVSNLAAGSYRLAIYDAMGNPVDFKAIQIAAPSQTIGIPCDQRFSAGVYVINLTGNGKTLSTKCIVQ